MQLLLRNTTLRPSSAMLHCLGMPFSRAAMSSSDEAQRSKNLNSLRYELENNPMFDRAFPSFKGKKAETTVRRKQEELDFIRSLGLKERVVKQVTLEEAEHENYKQFAEGYRSPAGPLRYLSSQEKAKINFLINEKMEELEATGLTREEILYDNPSHTSLPLSEDPFFQYLKRNEVAREVLLKQGEEYTVQKVIDLALRQDIGPDPSQGGANLKTQKSFLAANMGLPSAGKNLNAFDSSTFLGSASSTSDHLIRELVKPDMKRHEVPLTKSQIRARRLRRVNHFDIHWRNTELLTQFLNPSGMIKNKIQNRLTKPQQKQISRAVQLSREMLLIPHRGYIKASDRKSLTTLQEDVENSIRTAVNIESGHIYIKGSVNEYTNATSDFENLNDNFDAKRSEISKDYQIEGRGQSLQTTDELSLLEARMHAAQLKEQQLKDLGINTAAIRENYEKPKNVPSMTLENAAIIQRKQNVYPPEFDSVQQQTQEILKASFTSFQNRIEAMPIDAFAKVFVHEKATNVEAFAAPIAESSQLSVDEALQFVNSLRHRGGLAALQI